MCNWGGGKIKVFITSSDSLANLISDDRELWEKYQVFSGPLTALDTFSNKALMYNKCQKLGIEVKPFCLLSEYQSGMMSFPLILKRNVEKGLMEYKCCKIDDEQALYDMADEIPEESRQYILLQECIDTEFNDIDFRGYSHDGRIIGYSIVHEIRHYPEGVSSYLEEITDKRIVDSVCEKIEKLLNGSRFTGFFSIDIKYNFNSDESYILDFNPRSPASLSAWGFKYRRGDLVEFFRNIDHPSPLTPTKTSVKWCNLARDFRARSKNQVKFKVYDMLHCKFDLWDSRDPLPFLMQPLRILYTEMAKRYRKNKIS